MTGREKDLAQGFFLHVSDASRSGATGKDGGRSRRRPDVISTLAGQANGSSASLQFAVVRSFVRLCASSESGAVMFVANAIFERVVLGENHHHSGSAEAQRL